MPQVKGQTGGFWLLDLRRRFSIQRLAVEVPRQAVISIRAVLGRADTRRRRRRAR